MNAQLPELQGRVLPGKDFGAGGNGQTDRDKSAFGHGTAMASIMVARQGTLGITGIAPGARILPIAVPLSGTTDATADDHLAAAIRWAADHGAKIITMALGGTRYPKSSTEPCPADEQSAVFYAMRKGAVVLAAVGNRGQSDNAVEQPGVCLGVVTVGAANRDGSPASFSTRQRYLAFDAPGVGVPSLGRFPGTAYAGNGTSQATAIASAVTALVWSRYPKLSGRQVVTRLLATLDNRTDAPSAGTGYGLLDGYRAVTGTVPSGAANPIYAAGGAVLRPRPGPGRGGAEAAAARRHRQALDRQLRHRHRAATGRAAGHHWARPRPARPAGTDRAGRRGVAAAPPPRRRRLRPPTAAPPRDRRAGRRVARDPRPRSPVRR